VGGGGYTLRNVARCWCYETGRLMGVDLPDDLPMATLNEYNYFMDTQKLRIAVRKGGVGWEKHWGGSVFWGGPKPAPGHPPIHTQKPRAAVRLLGFGFIPNARNPPTPKVLRHGELSTPPPSTPTPPGRKPPTPPPPPQPPKPPNP
jgi:hypothetical protein